MEYPEDGELLKKICRLEILDQILSEYLYDCAKAGENSREIPEKKKATAHGRFPNFAGFCRYLGVGSETAKRILEDYPAESGRLLATLEDEALNSTVSPTLLSAYMKKRVGYEKESDTGGDTQIVCFDHDIWGDGE